MPTITFVKSRQAGSHPSLRQSERGLSPLHVVLLNIARLNRDLKNASKQPKGGDIPSAPSEGSNLAQASGEGEGSNTPEADKSLPPASPTPEADDKSTASPAAAPAASPTSQSTADQEREKAEGGGSGEGDGSTNGGGGGGGGGGGAVGESESSTGNAKAEGVGHASSERPASEPIKSQDPSTLAAQIAELQSCAIVLAKYGARLDIEDAKGRSVTTMAGHVQQSILQGLQGAAAEWEKVTAEPSFSCKRLFLVNAVLLFIMVYPYNSQSWKPFPVNRIGA